MTIIYRKRPATVAVRVRQRSRAIARRLADATRHGGASQGLGWLRNSAVHLMGVVSTAEPACTGG